MSSPLTMVMAAKKHRIWNMMMKMNPKCHGKRKSQ